MTSWTLEKVEDLIKDEVGMTKWLRQKRFIGHPKECVCGKHKFKIVKNREKVVFQCTNRNCKHRFTTKPAFMSKWKTNMKDVVKIIYYWAAKGSFSSIVTMSGMSDKMIARVTLMIRKGLAKFVQRNPPTLGGEGHTVEIDEVEVGRKRKGVPYT